VKSSTAWLLGSASLLAASAGQAFAQPAPQADSATLAEVVVTATRREENLQRVPVAVTAFSQDSLHEKAIASVMDLNSQVPGLAITAESGRGNAPQFAVRGIGPEYGAAAGSVEAYFADVPLSGPFQVPSMGPQFFDLQSLQVLKGPQGTLFGRSTTGGAVLIVPRSPGAEFGGYGRVQGGNYHNFLVEGAVDLPIVEDKALLRLAGFRWSRQGYGKTTAGRTDLAGRPLPVQRYDNQNVLELRGTLLLRPAEGLQNSTIVTYHRDKNRNTQQAGAVDPNTQLGGFISLLYPGIGDRPIHSADISTDLTKKPTQTWGVFNTTTYELSPQLLVKNIFGYIHAQGFGNVASDVDGTPLPAIDLPPVGRLVKQNQYTNELQLQGNLADDRLTWIAGGLLDKTRQPGGEDKGPLINVMNGVGGTNTYFQQNTFNNSALFGSATYKLTDRLSVSGGYRHSWVKIHVRQTNVSTNLAQYLANPNMIISAYPPSIVTNLDNRVKFQGDSYNVGLQYQWLEDTMVYGGYRRGFKQGGFNISSPPNQPEQQRFGPETVDDFSIGVKHQFAAGGVQGRINVEAFWDIYHDKQASYLTLTGAGANAALSTVTLNVPKTTYRGFDADVTFDLTDWVRLSANYTYIDAKYDEWMDPTFPATVGAPGCPVGGCVNRNLDLSVNPVAFVSPHKFAVTLRFHTELPNGAGELVLQPNVAYQDKLYTIGIARLLPQGETAWLGLPFDYNPSAHGGDIIRAYTLWNLRAEWNEIAGSKINAAVTVTNLADKDFSRGNTTSIPFGVEGVSYGPPRMFTFELSTRF